MRCKRRGQWRIRLVSQPVPNHVSQPQPQPQQPRLLIGSPFAEARPFVAASYVRRFRICETGLPFVTTTRLAACVPRIGISLQMRARLFVVRGLASVIGAG
jgi:hypothetical protein